MQITGFRQARWYYSGRREPVEVIVLHATETKEWGSTAKGICNYFATTDRKASAHLTVDNKEIWQSVRFQDTAFGASGANANGIHIEHIGLSAQSPGDWADEYSYAMLSLSAAAVRELCHLYSIPAIFIDAQAVKAGAKGITTHAEVNKAFPSTGHTDPGAGFPIHWYIRQVAQGGQDLDSQERQWLQEIHGAISRIEGAGIKEAAAKILNSTPTSLAEEAIKAAVKDALKEGTA